MKPRVIPATKPRPVTDIIIRRVEGYGFLPIVNIDGAEIYRGEFQGDEAVALDRAVDAVIRWEKEAAS